MNMMLSNWFDTICISSLIGVIALIVWKDKLSVIKWYVIGLLILTCGFILPFYSARFQWAYLKATTDVDGMALPGHLMVVFLFWWFIGLGLIISYVLSIKVKRKMSKQDRNEFTSK